MSNNNERTSFASVCVCVYLNITNFCINKEWFISSALFLTFQSFGADLPSLRLPLVLLLEVRTSGICIYK